MMLNVGCGQRFHAGWVNVDIAHRDPSVIAHDITCGLPFPDARFDVVYHSHVIEHIRRHDVVPFLQECLRVLKPGGILRVATPDLERLCELYLERLRAIPGDTQAPADHEWLMLEMLDQVVRERSGGAMMEFLGRRPLANEAFVLDRIGQEGRELLAAVRTAPSPTSSTPSRRRLPLPRGLRARFKQSLVKWWYGADAMRALEIGKFRLAGEVHQWLYDRVSLANVLLAAGFREPSRRSAVDSAIPGWNGFLLDTTADGAATKPDSLYMEAVRPA
jgi:predicted SAM-dependent methyltransferase